jgi:putative membrane protein
MLRLTLAWLHLVALGIGLWAVLARAEALRQASRELPGTDALRRAFKADTHWGVAALLWLVTGLWRYLGATEKSTDYYNSNHIFLTKMALFVTILVLEVWPMMKLIRWRQALGRAGGSQPGTGVALIDAGTARKAATISYVEGAIVTVMILTAVAMARGYGVRS